MNVNEHCNSKKKPALLPVILLFTQELKLPARVI